MAAASVKLGRRKMFGYALGVVPTALYSLIFGLKYIELFYDKLQLLPMYFVAGQIIYMTINALNDPISGQVSDNTDISRWGSRRLVYIKYGGPIWALTFISVWFPWSTTNQLIIFIHYVISICLFDTMLTLVVLCWMSLLPEMTTDHDERNKANFWVLVLGLVVALPFILILGEMSPTTDLFRAISIGIAIISTIALFGVTKLCEERPELHSDTSFPLVQSIKETLKLRSFRIYMGFSFFEILSGSFGLSYLFIYLLILGEGGLLYYVIFGILLGYVSNIWVLRLHEKNKWDMKTIVIRFSTVRLLATAILLPLILYTNIVQFIYLLMCFVALFTGYAVFSTPLMYLSMDEDEVKNDTRREGMFLGMSALFTKPANSIGPIVATFVLGASGYVTGSDVQPASAIFGIKLLFFAIPAMSAAVALLFMFFYPLYGEELQTMKKQLEQVHSERLSQSSGASALEFSARGSEDVDSSNGEF
ncbi:MAG: MFS transporter, partial [Candidatus Thorarchaeota archaeon]